MTDITKIIYYNIYLVIFVYFQELHRKLRPMCSELKNLELPSNSFKFIFGKNDKNSLDKAKSLIQKYLEVSRRFIRFIFI